MFIIMSFLIVVAAGAAILLTSSIVAGAIATGVMFMGIELLMCAVFKYVLHRGVQD